MTLKGRETKPLEWACNEIVVRAKNKGYETKGPVRIPTKILRVTTRKSPCGEGTNTWDRYEMRIHKRVIDIHCPSSVVKDITTFKIDASVDVNLIVWKQWSWWTEFWQELSSNGLILLFSEELPHALTQRCWTEECVYLAINIKMNLLYYRIKILINNTKNTRSFYLTLFIKTETISHFTNFANFLNLRIIYPNSKI